MKNYLYFIRVALVLVAAFTAERHHAHAQQANGATEQIQLFQSLTSQMTQEAVYVHMDQQTYFSGDSIWLSLDVVDQRFHRPSLWSRNAYVDLLTVDGKRERGIAVELEKGRGAGQIRIPENLASGIYFICAHTRWMRNAGTDQLAILPVFIVNPGQGVPEFKGEGLSRFIDFFPEGGNLIRGIENRMTFRILSATFLPADFEGNLVDDTGKEIVSVKSAVPGMGEFSFIPTVGRSYFLVPDSAFAGEVHQYPLPASIENGVALRIDPVKEGFHIATQMAGPPNSHLYWVAHANGLIHHTREIYLREGAAQFPLPFSELPEGINILTLLDEAGAVLAERRVFVPIEERLEVRLTNAETSAGRRQEVLLDIELSDEKGNPVQGDVSISVSLEDPLGHDPRTLPMQMALSGEHQPLSGVDDLFDREESDLWMRAHVPAEIQWTRFLEGAQKAPVYVPELYGPVVSGKVTNPKTGEAMPGATVILAVPGEQAHIYIGKSNREGMFLLSVPGRAQGKELVIRSIGPDGIPSQIEMPPLPRLNATQLPEPPQWPVDARQRMRMAFLHKQARDAYQVFTPRTASLPTQKELYSFYGKPDYVYTLDEFTRFTTEETFVEIVYSVSVRKKKGQFSMRVYNPAADMVFTDSPLLLIDGIPITDAGEILALKPRQLKRVEVITSRYCKGPSIFGGIVHAITYEGDAKRISKGDDLFLQSYDFPGEPSSFSRPDYSIDSQQESRLPDFKSLLYWNPAIQTNAEGKAQVRFFTGDGAGVYVIRAEALAPSGKTGSEIHRIEVQATE